jgi:hypothetical protein
VSWTITAVGGNAEAAIARPKAGAKDGKTVFVRHFVHTFSFGHQARRFGAPNCMPHDPERN